MLIMGLWIGLFAPRSIGSDKVYHHARAMILIGIGCIVVHFGVQFFLHQNPEGIAEIRTLINLLFGFPISFFMTLSVVYLQRMGTLSISDWTVIPLVYLSAIIVAIVLIPVMHVPNGIAIANVILSVFYTIALIYCCALQFLGYKHSTLKFLNEGNDYFVPILRWSRWIILITVLVSFGFPFMTFCPDEILRAAYGLLAIMAGFLYSISFYLLGLSPALRNETKPSTEHIDSPSEVGGTAEVQSAWMDETPKNTLAQRDLVRIEMAVKEFVAGRFYMQSGITIRDVVAEMDVPLYQFRAWLRTTPYDKFNNWLVAIRLERAKAMLLRSDNPSNKEVAQLCGFCDRYYFQSQFRKFEGMSPSQWVENQKLPPPSKSVR